MTNATGRLGAVLLCIGSSLLVSAPTHADPSPAVPPAPGEGVNVPGMKFGVNVSQPCNRSSDKFGRNNDGITLVCVTDADDDKPVTIWVRAMPLAGVRQVGASCYGKESEMTAMSPNGDTMICAGTYDPEHVKNGKDYVWTISD